ncbi:toll/interleukin-1 receptor domain-containing adapter protein isoform 4-T9 [Glossophaga mutica]
MASPTSFPASGSRSKKPLGRMAGWLRQALSKKPKKMPASRESAPSDALPGCSQDDAPPPCSQDDPPPRCPQDHPPSSGLSSAALAESPALPPAQEGATSSSSGGRWSRDYDVCVCHSEEDLAAAQELVAYLENCSASLRCFLQLRDAAPGSAIVSELCRALDSSHCQVLLITPGFQRDPWCRSADAQVTLLMSRRDPEGWRKAGNRVREPRALDPAGVTGPEELELVALSM